MRRRWLVLAGVAVVAGLTVGTGGYSTATADRTVAVDVVGEEDAFMSLVYAEAPVSLDGSEPHDRTLVTVRNQFTQPVDITVEYAVDSDGGLTVEPPSGAETHESVAVGEAVAVPVTLTCQSSDTQYATASFDVTADGAGVFAETVTSRTVTYAVACPSSAAVTVRFRGQGNARVSEQSSLDDTNGTVWTLKSDGTVERTSVDVAARGGTVRSTGSGTVIAVALDATDRTYFHPALRSGDNGFEIASAMTGNKPGSNDPADPVCDGSVEPDQLRSVDGQLTCPA